MTYVLRPSDHGPYSPPLQLVLSVKVRYFNYVFVVVYFLFTECKFRCHKEHVDFRLYKDHADGAMNMEECPG